MHATFTLRRRRVSYLSVAKGSLLLSVVSMEVFAPHNMAEIKHRHDNEGVPDPRIIVFNN